MPEMHDLAAGLMKRLRDRKRMSRGQVARRLKVSSTVVYNMETGRTRVGLDHFIVLVTVALGDPRSVLGRHLFSVQGLPSLDPAEIIKAFRGRLQVSQKQLATILGFRSGSMVHHFEKGIRVPSLVDYLTLMKAAGDNLSGLAFELTGNEAFSGLFPAGREARQGDWQAYWQSFYIPAIRQIMRTNVYRSQERYDPGFFSDILGIDYKEERHALAVLGELGLIRWQKAKPIVNTDARIVVPKDIPKSVLDGFKSQWAAFARRRFESDKEDAAMATLDLLPANRQVFEIVRDKIRGLQDEIHNMRLRETTGFIYLGWNANFVALNRKND